MLTRALHDVERGVYLRYILDGSLFHLRKLNAKTKTLERLNPDALFAEVCALMEHSESDLQTIGLTSDASLDKETACRISKASQSLGRLRS